MSVQIGNISFTVTGGTPEERAGVERTLQAFKSMQKVQAAFGNTNASDSFSNQVEIKLTADAFPDNLHGGYLDAKTNIFTNKLTSATIYLNIQEIDDMRFGAAKGGPYVQGTVPSVLANELGDLAALTNPDFVSGERDPIWGVNPANTQDARDRASIRFENDVGRKPYDLPERNVNGEKEINFTGDGTPDDISVFPSDPEHTKAEATANQGGVNPHAESGPDDSTDNDGDDFDDWMDRFKDDLDAMNPASAPFPPS